MLHVDIEKKLSSFTLCIRFTAEGATAMIGPSGCGKSVTLKCISGIMKPDRGRIEYNGQVLFDSERHINLPPQKRRIGYLFQNYALFPDMTVRENILAGLKREKDRKRKNRILNDTAELLHISHVLESKPYQLSGGEAQRTALARMIVNDPDLMLFDEPFSALDMFLRDELRAQFSSLMNMLGKDRIIITHSIDEAYSLSRRMLIMDKGHIIDEGDTASKFLHPASEKSARIMGFRNITTAYPADNGKISIPGWNMQIQRNGENTSAVCLMEGDIMMAEDNGIQASVLESLSLPDFDLLRILIKGGSEPLWMRIPKEMHSADRKDIQIIIKENSIRTMKDDSQGHDIGG